MAVGNVGAARAYDLDGSGAQARWEETFGRVEAPCMEAIVVEQEQMKMTQAAAQAGMISAQRAYNESPQETRRTALHMALECARICPVADADSLIATAGKIEAYLRGDAG